jgi:hypothetical protein
MNQEGRGPEGQRSIYMDFWSSDPLTPRLLATAGLLYATADRGPRATLAALEASIWGHNTEIRLYVKWAIMGQMTGHEWHYCPICRQLRLMVPAKARRCGMTPKCAGTMARISPRPRMTRKLALLFVADGTS